MNSWEEDLEIEFFKENFKEIECVEIPIKKVIDSELADSS